jgi:phosphoribosyl-ATP pyrophosphohydrolase
MSNVIDELTAVLRERQAYPVADSYTAQLLAAGEDEIVKKIGEEAIELILAAKGQGNQRLIEEMADLVYHSLVLLVSRDLSWQDITSELVKRRQA